MARLRQSTIRALRAERRRLLDELSCLALLIRGSFFERFSTCSRPGCACHAGRRHGPRCYVGVTQKKTQKQHYVPQPQVEAVARGVSSLAPWPP